MNAIAASDLLVRGFPPAGSVTRDLPLPSPVVAGGLSASDPEQPAPPPPHVELRQLAEGVNTFLKSGGSHVQFAIHEGTNRVMVEVIDDRTEEVIRTIPTRELLDLAARIGDMVGTFLDEKG